jgi:hypothetical protein
VLDVLAPDVGGIAVVEVVAVVVERASVRARAARAVDAALGAHVRDVEVDGTRERPQGDAHVLQMDRTQQVAGSSPASSIGP